MNQVIAQQVSITGYVVDGNTNETLLSATIKDSASKKGVVTNNYGFFSLTLPMGKVKLNFSYVGYESKQVEFLLEKDTTLKIYLSPNPALLNEVVVTQKNDLEVLNKNIGLVDIPVERLKAVPAILGETDIIKAIAFTPGVSMGNEGTASLLVRGGSPDQNMILLDEAPVYNTAHLFGIFSIFNTDAIKKVELYKAGFPALFGGRLSSVLDLTMKDGNSRKKNKELTIGLLSSRILLEGPLSKKTRERSSYMVSGRTSYFTPFLLPSLLSYKFGKSANYFHYWMYDINAKLNYTLKNNDKVFLSFYHGNDFWNAGEKADNNKTKFKLYWGNVTFTSRYNKIINPKLFLKSAFIYSFFNHNIANGNYFKANNDWLNQDFLRTTSSVRDVSFHTHLDYFPNHQHQIKIGAEVANLRFFPTKLKSTFILNADSLQKINQPVNANKIVAFIEDEIKIGSFSANLGLRANSYQLPEKTFFVLEPRLSFNMIFLKSWAFKAGYAQMNQFIHQLMSNTVGLPNEIWVPATQKAPPQFSEQYSIGLSKSLPVLGLEFSFEAYQKTMRNLIDYQTGNSFFTSLGKSWENTVERGGLGNAKGAELFLNKTQGRLTGWLGYTYATNNRKFEGINQGKWFPAPFDRRHYFTAVGNYKSASEKISYSTSWVFYTGQPVTVPIALRQNIGDERMAYPIFIYGDRNNFRMPPYHRLDLSMTIKNTTKRHRDITWIFGVYNAYNRQNPYYIDFKKYTTEAPDGKTNGVDYRLVKKSIIPILPYVSYSLKIL